MNHQKIISERISIKMPFSTTQSKKESINDGAWPAYWIECPQNTSPCVSAYRRIFNLDNETTIRIHVSADERYILYVDGQNIGRGPERGVLHHWFYETYEVNLSAGRHVIVAQVWALGDMASYAQLSLKSGFLLAAEEPYGNLLSTGVAEWETKRLKGYTFTNNTISWGVAGPDQTINAHLFDWEFEHGEGKNWETAVTGQQAFDGEFYREHQFNIRHLYPAQLPAMVENDVLHGKIRHIESVSTQETWKIKVDPKNNIQDGIEDWSTLRQEGKPVEIPANTSLRLIIDLEDYYCAYPQIITSKGNNASIRIHWAESLFEKSQPNHQDYLKGNRNEIFNKYFIGVGDTIKTDGGLRRCFKNLWWRAGRYVELLVQTEAQPLTIEKLEFLETHYPLEMQSSFSANHPGFDACMPIMVRSMQMCSHETYMDCPYYEQLMYVGDTRLEALTTYCMTLDSRLPRKAIQMFDLSRIHNSLTQSRYPSRMVQVIPPFSLWWIAMVYDCALWRGDRKFVHQKMAGVRSVIEAFLAYQNMEGLIVSPQGWNFADWVCDDNGTPLWKNGVPPCGKDGISGQFNWQMVLVLTMVRKLELWMGEEELAERADRISRQMAETLIRVFWNEEKGLFADDPEKCHYSEHTQCMAVLSGLLDKSFCNRLHNTLFNTPGIAQTTIYFSHYLFETCRILGRMDKLFDRLNLWFELPTSGLKTTFEAPGNTRSDCHAWGAHPIYHCFATILGIRPSEFGFSSVQIKPQLGPLTEASGVFLHPLGKIKMNLKHEGSLLNCDITLPEGLKGELIGPHSQNKLNRGQQIIQLPLK